MKQNSWLSKISCTLKKLIIIEVGYKQTGSEIKTLSCNHIFFIFYSLSCAFTTLTLLPYGGYKLHTKHQFLSIPECKYSHSQWHNIHTIITSTYDTFTSPLENYES